MNECVERGRVHVGLSQREVKMSAKAMLFLFFFFFFHLMEGERHGSAVRLAACVQEMSRESGVTEGFMCVCVCVYVCVRVCVCVCVYYMCLCYV